jgi:hypothetical protein
MEVISRFFLFNFNSEAFFVGFVYQRSVDFITYMFWVRSILI